MNNAKTIQAVNLNTMHTIIGQPLATDKTQFNMFKVKHVAYSACGKFIRYKVDKIAPHYEKLDIEISAPINKRILVTA